MNIKVWLGVLGLAILYVGAVLLLGISGPVAISINFARVVSSVAVLAVLVPTLGVIFQEVPAPARDYFRVGLLFIALSGTGFTFWNEAGRTFGANTSVFSSPIAGAFAYFLVLGMMFVLIAIFVGPGTSRKTAIIAMTIGVVTAVALVFIAPLFR